MLRQKSSAIFTDARLFCRRIRGGPVHRPCGPHSPRSARHLPLKGKACGRVTDPPLRRIQKLFPPLAGAGHWLDRGRGEPLPCGFQGHIPSLGRGGPWASRRQRTGRRSFGNVRRGCGTAAAATLHTQGPVARKEFRLSLRFPRAGNFAELLRRDSRKTGSGVRRIWARQCPS